MEKEMFAAILPAICSDLIAKICATYNISETQAIEKLYNSKLYFYLEKEETKVWHYSTDMLLKLFEQEEENDHIDFPDT